MRQKSAIAVKLGDTDHFVVGDQDIILSIRIDATGTVKDLDLWVFDVLGADLEEELAQQVKNIDAVCFEVRHNDVAHGICGHIFWELGELRRGRDLELEVAVGVVNKHTAVVGVGDDEVAIPVTADAPGVGKMRAKLTD